MNKLWKISGVVAVLVAVVAFAGVTAALAQGPNQPGGFTSPGRNQAQDGSSIGMGSMAVDEATMHAAVAEALHLSIEEFEAAVAEGKTSYILAQELGIDFAAVQAAMDAVHSAALQQAADEGVITQQQADWIASHRGGQNRQGSGMNGGLSNDQTGRMGRGSGSNGDYSGDCLYQTP
jgi:hypothetical protein